LNSSGNKGLAGIVSAIKSPCSLLSSAIEGKTRHDRQPPVGISAAALALGLALNLAVLSKAFAADPMSQDIDFRNSVAGQGGTRRDTTVRETAPRDARKKDDGTKHYGSSK